MFDNWLDWFWCGNESEVISDCMSWWLLLFWNEFPQELPIVSGAPS